MSATASETTDGCWPADSWVCWGDVANNLAASGLQWLLVAAVGVITALVGRRVLSRRGQLGGDYLVLTAGVRDRLITTARSRAWGQLDDLIGLPEGYTEWSVPAGTGIVELFLSSRQQLLVVGDPGSGKTLLAYKMAERLDRRASSRGDGCLSILMGLRARLRVE